LPRRGGDPGAIDDLHGSDVPKELKLVGQRVDPALESLDRFLDAAVLAGHEEVRIVHGHGTGRLRQAVRDLLRQHAHVLGQRSGQREEGGDGVTVVTLR
jgi:DNA mismatch repair protein MutS2